MAHGDDDFAAAIGLLARGLAGAIEVSGLEHVPRPTFANAPTTTAPTTTAPTTTAPTTTAPTTTEGPARVRQRIDAVAKGQAPHADRLQILCDDVIGACTRCKLHRGRNRLVFGAGNPNADLVFVGEGPGEDEDREGVPFVGRAGQLLTKMIVAMGRDRDRDVYICNVVKCRPPNNRTPEPDEIDACLGFLDAQLAIIKPKVIVGLGGTACHTLLQTTTPISKLRGQWKTYRGIPFMPTFHPSYLLREARDEQQTRKRETWNDLQQVMLRLQQP